MKRTFLALLAFTVSVGCGYAVYQRSAVLAEHKTDAPKPQALTTVRVEGLQVRSIQQGVSLVGSLEAAARIEIRARTNGYITALPFDIGDSLKAGEVVVELDSSTTQEMLTGAEAALTVAKAQLKSKKTQEELAKELVKRHEKLAADGVTTVQQQQQVAADYAIAAAEVELAQARVDQAASDVQRARINLRENKISTPTSGLVAARLVDVGDLAKPDVPLMEIVNIDSVRTVVHVVEKNYQKVELGQKAMIEVDAFPGHRFRGTVIRKAPVIDPETRTASVQIEIPNSEGMLKPGMYARVDLVFSRVAKAPTIPAGALVPLADRGKSWGVYIAAGNPPHAELREIAIGLRDGDRVEVRSGLQAKDQIITLGRRMVEDGQPVHAIAKAPSHNQQLESESMVSSR